MNPIALAANRPAERFYRGGERLRAFRGDQGAAPREPEDWVGSVTTVRGEETLGLSTLPDGGVPPRCDRGRSDRLAGGRARPAVG